MKIDAKQALQLSQWFREVAVELGNYRYDKWKVLTPAQRQVLEDEEWSLLNSSSDLISKAIGLILDDAVAFEKLTQATTQARKAVKTLKTVKKVIKVATAAVGLAAAIVAKDPGAVTKNTKALYDAATDENA